MDLNADETYCLAVNGEPHFMRGKEVEKFITWTKERLPGAKCRLFKLTEIEIV